MDMDGPESGGGESGPVQAKAQHLARVQPGDAVFASTPIVNDGSIPGCEKDEVLANVGDMGMLINIGYVELDPDTELFLVSFPLEDGQPGPPVTCLAEEISAEPITAATGG